MTTDNKEQSSFSQTSKKSDKKWKLGTSISKHESVYWNAKGMYSITVPHSLLDQLRRDERIKTTRELIDGESKSALTLLIKEAFDKAIQEAKKELLDVIWSECFTEYQTGINHKKEKVFKIFETDFNKIRAKTLGENVK